MKIIKKKNVFFKNLQNVLSIPLILISVSCHANALSIEDQRQNYLDADASIKRKDLVAYKHVTKNIKNYPLFPYLDFQYQMQELNHYSVNQAIEFSDKYKNLPFANTIRNSYLSQLAKKEAWSDFLSYQPILPRSEKHQCNYYYAKSQTGSEKIALNGAKKLFLSGDSIHSSCDKLFELLDESKGITDTLLLDRMLLAFEKRNKPLLVYLQKKLSEHAKKQGEFIVSLYDEPQQVADFSKKRKVTVFYKKLTMLAFEKLAQTSREKAVAAFTHTVEGQRLSVKEQQQLADYLIHRLMSSTDTKLVEWRDTWLKKTQKENLIERRFRLALVDNDWKQMAFWLDILPKEDKQKLKWRYWEARIAAHKGNKKAAEKIYLDIIGQRDFYSVAAAMHLGKPIEIPSQTTVLDKTKLTAFKPALNRVDEFFQLKKISDAKREWQHLLNKANAEQTAMLAAYAKEKGWHHLAVQATISGKLWEHLAYRFPIAHKEWFEFYSKERSLPLTTLLALSRQESAFYTNARSPVGARGLMQIMPATAKETSRKLGVRYLGKHTLKDPVVNIGLGSGYLKMLLDNYEKNRILAFAAYNAGPHRVKTWQSKSKGQLDPIAFIEAIPFSETRGYVQNVLMYDIYYRKLLGMPLTLLQPQEIDKKY